MYWNKKRVVNVARLELGPVLNEWFDNFTFYRNSHKFYYLYHSLIFEGHSFETGPSFELFSKKRKYRWIDFIHCTNIFCAYAYFYLVSSCILPRNSKEKKKLKWSLYKSRVKNSRHWKLTVNASSNHLARLKTYYIWRYFENPNVFILRGHP